MAQEPRETILIAANGASGISGSFEYPPRPAVGKPAKILFRKPGAQPVRAIDICILSLISQFSIYRDCNCALHFSVTSFQLLCGDYSALSSVISFQIFHLRREP